MKRIISLVLIMVMVLSLSGCGLTNAIGKIKNIAEEVEKISDNSNNSNDNSNNSENSNDNQNDDDEGNKDNSSDSNTDSKNNGTSSEANYSEIALKNFDREKWPAKVFEPFGITEFKEAKDIYNSCYEEDGVVMAESVSTLVNCTRSELIAYVESLLAKGFHTDQMRIDDMATRKWDSMNLYLPGYGHSYYCYIYYSFENEGAGGEMYTGTYDEEGNDVYIMRNVSIHMSWYYNGPSGWDETITALEELGINDQDLHPDIDDIGKRIDGASLERYYNTDTGETTALYFGFGTAFDYYIEEDFFYDYVRKIQKLLKSKDTDGELNELSFGDELPVVDVDAETPVFWILYNYGGKTWSVMFSSEIDYGGEIFITVMPVSK